MPALSNRPRAVRRIGHKGADHIAPGNTLASFDAALAQGVDMIEFDVLSENVDGSGRLLLSHDYTDAGRPAGTVLELEEGLTHFATDAPHHRQHLQLHPERRHQPPLATSPRHRRQPVSHRDL